MIPLVTTLLDIAGLLLLSAGAAAATYAALGWACLAVAGVVLLTGSQFAAWSAKR